MTTDRRRARLVDAAAVAALVVLSAWLVDPTWRGTMPLSADHTVHLTRIHLWREVLAAGHLRGFRPEWGFGVPIGEFYPILGDALVLGLDAILPGGLRAAYAVGFFVAFTAQALAAWWTARLCGAGRLGSVLAGAAVVCDLGTYREGGYVYTVTYGVWPQALATALVFPAVALAVRFVIAPRPRPRTGALAALLGGLALLAHPMALLVLAIHGAAALAVAWADAPKAAVRTAVRGALALALALALAAFFLGPMLRFRGYMASYGWLGLPVRFMVDQLLGGALARHVVPPATVLALLGTGAAALARRPVARTLAVGAVVCWALSTRELFWDLRLDRLSSGFAHVQYQRFLAVAKFGAYVLAGFAAGRIAALGSHPRVRRWRPVPWVLRGAAAAAAVSVVLLQLRALERAGPAARIQTARYPGDPGAEADWRAVADEIARRFREREGFFRFAARAPRNAHDLVDLTVETGAPIYKAGFTPGDNFVHKPESMRPEVLDALAVRTVVERVRHPGRRGTSTPPTSGGRIRLRERTGALRPVAWLEGPGTLTLEEDDRYAPRVRGRIEGAGPSTRIVFAVAGHPRFRLTMAGEPVPWVEVPVFGDAPPVRPEDRLAGRVRGGKALGDDGSEPILIAAPARDGPFELSYAHSLPFDRLAGAASALAALLLGAALLRPGRAAGMLARFEDRFLARLPAATVPLLAALVLGALAVRYVRAARDEADHLFARLDGAEATFAAAGPIKTDMWIRPAVLLAPRGGRPARLRLSDLPAGRYDGFYALDDDAAKLGPKGRATLTIRVWDAGGSAREQRHRVRHRPGSVPLAVEVPEGGTVEIEVTAEGAPPPVAVDLWPEGAP